MSELGSALKGFYVGAVPAKTGTLKVRSSDGSALFFSSYSYTFWPILLQRHLPSPVHSCTPILVPAMDEELQHQFYHT